MDKLRRKEEKRSKRGADNGSAYDIAAESFSSLLLASEKKQPFDGLIGTGEGLKPCALPQGTTRLCEPGFEEVIIPPTPTAPMRPDEKLVFRFSYCSLSIHRYMCHGHIIHQHPKLLLRVLARKAWGQCLQNDYYVPCSPL